MKFKMSLILYQRVDPKKEAAWGGSSACAQGSGRGGAGRGRDAAAGGGDAHLCPEGHSAGVMSKLGHWVKILKYLKKQKIDWFLLSRISPA